ncbi:MAG: TlpA disulfide reductase family protein [Acidobacteriota bacterium]
MVQANMARGKWWTNRWWAALGVAAAIAASPVACDRNVTLERAQQGVASGEAAGGATAQPVANLDFVLKNIEGQDVRLADLKGKPLLINFWATWCGPCKAEIPWFVEFADRYKAKGLTVVGISVDDPPEDIKTFAAQFKVNYPMLVGRDRADIAKAFDAEQVIPVSWLIRADGSVQAKVTGIHGKNWFDEQIQAMF